MTKRQFGSIRKLPSGRLQARYLDRNGEERTAPETFASKTAAGKWLSAVETDLMRGEWTDPRLASKTFGEWSEVWWNSLHVRPNTRRGYEVALRVHVMPVFENRPVGSITHVDVKRFVGDMLDDGAAPGTVIGARKVLRLVLQEAVNEDALKKNVCDRVRVPRGKREEMAFLSADEVEVLADAIANLPRPYSG